MNKGTAWLQNRMMFHLIEVSDGNKEKVIGCHKEDERNGEKEDEVCNP
jgi:hypothetical protein